MDAPPPPPPPPMFSEAELAAAKQSAFHEGHAAGTKEVEESRAQALSNMMQLLAADTQSLFKAEAAREATYEREVLALCHAMFKNAFPRLHEMHGFDALITQLSHIIKSQQGQNSIEVRVSETYAAGVQGFMDKLQQQNSDLRFNVLSDANISDGAFQLKWTDGGAIYNAQEIARTTLENLDEMLAGSDTNGHDNNNDSALDTPEEVSNVVSSEDSAQAAPQDDNMNAKNNPIAEENNE